MPGVPLEKLLGRRLSHFSSWKPM